VFGMGASAIALHEGLPGWKLLSAALVMAGLGMNLLATRRRPTPAPLPAAATTNQATPLKPAQRRGDRPSGA